MNPATNDSLARKAKARRAASCKAAATKAAKKKAIQDYERGRDDSLARAIESLGAVEVVPGRYAYPIPGGGWATTETFEQSIGESLGGGFFVPNPVVMPSWWSPERRFAIRSGSLPDVILCTMVRLDDANSPTPAYKVTADLATGAEVPA